MDDAFSVTALPGDCYRVHIHISDVAYFVSTNSAIDKEASVRAHSTYVMRAFHLPMLPHDLNAKICSLVQGEERLAISLQVDINSEGLIDYRSMRFSETIILNNHKLSY